MSSVSNIGAMTNHLISKSLHKDIIVPAIAIGSLFAEANKEEYQNARAHQLGNALTGSFLGVFFSNLDKGLLGVVGTSIVLIRSFDKKDKRDKISSIVKDSLWIGCGLAAQKLLSSKIFYRSHFKPKGVFGFLSEMSSFMVGSLLLSPVLNKFAHKYFVDPYFPKKDEQLKAEQEAETSALPLHMDKYNINKIILPQNTKQSDLNNTK